MIKDHVIIFFPWVDWEAPWQRYQHFALNFSKSNRVAYMNPALAISYLMRNPGVLLKKWFRFFMGKKKISSNLAIYSPPPCLPFERQSRWINYINQYILFFYIKYFVKPEGSLILWINNPYKYFMIKLLKPKITVYDCPDAVVFKDNRKQMLYDRLRKRTLQESTVSCFTSKPLLKEGKKYAKNSFYIPNGVDIKTFVQKKYENPEIVDNISGPILGLVGTFDERVDIDLLDFMLKNIPMATLVMVGPVQRKLGNLGKNRRIILPGKKDYQTIPSFINKFDVALIPYRVNEVTECVYPVKLHEYLILGKPIVSTDLPEVRQFSDVVLIARSKEEFVRQVLHALKDNDEIKIQKRIEVAKNNSWEKRISEISKKIQPYLR